MSAAPDDPFVNAAAGVVSLAIGFCPICGIAGPFHFLPAHMSLKHNCHPLQPLNKLVNAATPQIFLCEPVYSQNNQGTFFQQRLVPQIGNSNPNGNTGSSQPLLGQSCHRVIGDVDQFIPTQRQLGPQQSWHGVQQQAQQCTSHHTAQGDFHQPPTCSLSQPPVDLAPPSASQPHFQQSTFAEQQHAASVPESPLDDCQVAECCSSGFCSSSRHSSSSTTGLAVQHLVAEQNAAIPVEATTRVDCSQASFDTQQELARSTIATAAQQCTAEQNRPLHAEPHTRLAHSQAYSDRPQEFARSIAVPDAQHLVAVRAKHIKSRATYIKTNTPFKHSHSSSVTQSECGQVLLDQTTSSVGRHGDERKQAIPPKITTAVVNSQASSANPQQFGPILSDQPTLSVGSQGYESVSTTSSTSVETQRTNFVGHSNPLLNAMAAIGLLVDNRDDTYQNASSSGHVISDVEETIVKQCYFCSTKGTESFISSHERTHVDNFMWGHVALDPRARKYIQRIFPLVLQRKVNCKKCVTVTDSAPTFLTVQEQVYHIRRCHLQLPLRSQSLKEHITSQMTVCFPKLSNSHCGDKESVVDDEAFVAERTSNSVVKSVAECDRTVEHTIAEVVDEVANGALPKALTCAEIRKMSLVEAAVSRVLSRGPMQSRSSPIVDVRPGKASHQSTSAITVRSITSPHTVQSAGNAATKQATSQMSAVDTLFEYMMQSKAPTDTTEIGNNGGDDSAQRILNEAISQTMSIDNMVECMLPSKPPTNATRIGNTSADDSVQSILESMADTAADAADAYMTWALPATIDERMTPSPALSTTVATSDGEFSDFDSLVGQPLRIENIFDIGPHDFKPDMSEWHGQPATRESEQRYQTSTKSETATQPEQPTSSSKPISTIQCNADRNINETPASSGRIQRIRKRSVRITIDEESPGAKLPFLNGCSR